jgi:diguanylate cyclase (GGDEF)-like protein
MTRALYPCPPAPPVMHILIADDDPGTRLIVAAAVERLGHDCTVAVDGAEAWIRFPEVRPDVVIADWEMPGLDGTELTRRIRRQVDVPYPYVIVLTARAGQEHALGAMEAGADDLVFKPLQSEELQRMLVGAARVTTLHRRLHRDARQDALTGLGNRHRLTEDLEAMHARAQRYGHRWCAALVDVDHFKGYNDGAGHLEGDRLLRRIGAALASTVRGGDTVYRYGGEEFLVLLPEQTLDTAALAAERLRGVVEDLGVAHPDGGVVTVSVGVAGPAGGGDAADALVARADAALYAAKAAGRNRIELAGAEAPGDDPIRLMIADDDELVRMLVSTIAEHEPALDLVGTAEDAAEAVKVAVMRRPQVVLLDFDMPRGGGVQAAIDIQREVPEARIVALSSNETQLAMLDMARAGAVGYIVKGAPPAEIVDTIRSSARF